MKKITVLSGLLLLAGLAAQAQERVAEYNVRPAVTVRTPCQGDSINFKGDKFDYRHSSEDEGQSRLRRRSVRTYDC